MRRAFQFFGCIHVVCLSFPGNALYDDYVLQLHVQRGAMWPTQFLLAVRTNMHQGGLALSPEGWSPQNRFHFKGGLSPLQEPSH